ncbi:Spy/CpxP family protein refolding chaperone [Agarivorans sp. MS3-6]|uniref:Spy/CpxP family protein refolding chaperone n=1 Tax=Agarivorans sp. TSD2052 TaxID=2937286 RepID=UPI00200EC1D7|nr:Spy/CpxP family protein refolding chaperone [Agarivorans sp. TSD2052]UPW18862.1 Spy/CpxP family protein refolding chaperone [Agarivorans sp. TSD2052]
MKKLLVTALVGALVVAPVAFAAKGEKQGGKQDQRAEMHMMKQLDLSAEQKQQVKAIMQAQKKQQPNTEQRAMMHEQRMAIITSATFDKDAAQTLITQQQAMKQSRMLDKLEAQHQVYQLLTPEQQTKYQELVNQKMEKHQQRMEKGGKKGQTSN